MKRSRTALNCVMSLSLLAPALSVFADAKPNQYTAISGRNVFQLKPAQLINTTAIRVEPALKVILTGTTDILGNALALLEVHPSGKPEIHLMLSEGQHFDDITLLAINQKKRSVTIRNGNTTQTLEIADVNNHSSAQSLTLPISIAPAPPAQDMTAEEQVIQIEISRQLTKDDVAKGKMPPLPPTLLSPDP